MVTIVLLSLLAFCAFVLLRTIASGGGPAALRGGGSTGGPRRGIKGLPTWMTAVFVAGTVVLVLAVPALVIAGFFSNDQLPSNANIEGLTADEQHGRELFGQRCKSCHTLEASNSSAKVGPNLDTLEPSEQRVLDAIENGRARGNGQMPADLVQGEDAEAVAKYVAKAAGASSE